MKFSSVRTQIFQCRAQSQTGLYPLALVTPNQVTCTAEEGTSNNDASHLVLLHQEVLQTCTIDRMDKKRIILTEWQRLFCRGGARRSLLRSGNLNPCRQTAEQTGFSRTTAEEFDLLPPTPPPSVLRSHWLLLCSGDADSFQIFSALDIWEDMSVTFSPIHNRQRACFAEIAAGCSK